MKKLIFCNNATLTRFQMQTLADVKVNSLWNIMLSEMCSMGAMGCQWLYFCRANWKIVIIVFQHFYRLLLYCAIIHTLWEIEWFPVCSTLGQYFEIICPWYQNSVSLIQYFILYVTNLFVKRINDWCLLKGTYRCCNRINKHY